MKNRGAIFFLPHWQSYLSAAPPPSPRCILNISPSLTLFYLYVNWKTRSTRLPSSASPVPLLPFPLKNCQGQASILFPNLCKREAGKARQTSTRGKKKSRRGDNSFFFPQAGVVKSLVYKHRARAISRTMVEEERTS